MVPHVNDYKIYAMVRKEFSGNIYRATSSTDVLVNVIFVNRLKLFNTT